MRLVRGQVGQEWRRLAVDQAKEVCVMAGAERQASAANDFEFGPAWSGNRCCGKPVGCTNVSSGCQMLNHPWKRRLLPVGEKKTDD